MLWLTQGRLDHLPKAGTLRFNPFLTVTGFMTISCHPASSLGSGATRERLQPPRWGVGRALVTKWGSCCGNEPTRLLYLLDLLLLLLFWGPGQYTWGTCVPARQSPPEKQLVKSSFPLCGWDPVCLHRGQHGGTAPQMGLGSG